MSHPDTSRVECTNMGNSVLVVSIIRLEITVDMAPDPDITWSYVRYGIWWLVYNNFENQKDMANRISG
jgi:hypothetical protein